MRVLLITGKLAKPILEEAVKNMGDEVSILALDYPVASLMSIRYILERLKVRKESLSGYDYLILPGLVYGDAKIIEKELGIKTFKGTENAWDVVRVIEALRNGVELSTIYPADVILNTSMIEDAKKILERVEADGNYVFDVGFKVPLRPPPFRLLLELDPSHPLDRWIHEIERVKLYVDGVVVGFPVGFSDLGEVRRRVKSVRDLIPVVGIDSDSPYVLREGVREGATLVFNLNEENIEKLEELRKDSAFVVAPFSTENRAELTVSLVRRARLKGFERLIADPVLSPPLMGFTESIMDYAKLRTVLPDTPLMMGTLNVTELIDADSHGVNSLLAVMGMELGVSILLTMEKGKTRWSAWELREATKMVSVAYSQGKVPKDVGIDLLILKDKRRLKVPPPQGKRMVARKLEPEMDKTGFAHIVLDDRRIVVSFTGKKEVSVEGEDGLLVGRTLLREVEGISPEHALYIGYELAKAEIAGHLDKNYVQDKPLVRRIGLESYSAQSNSTEQ
ncbi:dihydropteroate synthase-like protein [Metallosphaera javensis (ex Sakai et al. 2022)]|uniref:dihydropteroate synthase-like protein n=1 Tax=Metallosphaera javensis (ex Sakai et al. 2022) TaxID=2775498 RepID=UPI0025826766|nr:MAG: dihydropteroate synthase [Metallosphaera javensis (ex Sakai et al. 2022)]